MTGTSKDIADPVYTYDTLGTNCLDTLQEFITQNNPEGLGATEWKDKYVKQTNKHIHSTQVVLSIRCNVPGSYSFARLFVRSFVCSRVRGSIQACTHIYDGFRWRLELEQMSCAHVCIKIFSYFF